MMLFALLDKVVEADDRKTIMCGLQFVNIRLLDFFPTVVDDVLNVFVALEWIDELGKKRRIEEDGFGVRLIQRVCKSLFAQGVVSGDDWH